MEIDVIIDRLTRCLVERDTGKVVDTEFKKRIQPIKKKDYRSWKFQWDLPEQNGYDIYELYVKGDNTVQGRIALKITGGVADVNIVETAPHNYGHTGIYEGVGGHLFAIACYCSLQAGCEGVVAFTAKSNLVDYYEKELHAVEVSTQRMVIFEEAAQRLLEMYIRK